MYKFIAFSLLVAAVAVVQAEEKLDCLSLEDPLSCYSAKLVGAVSRNARSVNIKFVDGVSLVPDNSASSKFFHTIFFAFFITIKDSCIKTLKISFK